MAQKPIDMNLAKQIQQLHNDGVAIKEIVRRIGISRTTVRKYLRIMELLPPASGEGQVIAVSEQRLAAIIYNNDITPIAGRRRENLDEHFENAKMELHKTGVNKQILWMEYLDKYPDGYKYSQYCRLFMKYLKNTDPAFHWEYEPGEFTQVDFAGKKLSYTNKQTGEVTPCPVFVGTLPFSGLIFCIAIESEKTGDVLGTQGGVLGTQGGALGTQGGALGTQGGALSTQGGVLGTQGGVLGTQGDVLGTQGGVLGTQGGALGTQGGVLGTQGGALGPEGGVLGA